MIEYNLGVVESRFADIVWSHAPMSTAELIKLCAEELNWKRTTTYTVLKKLGDKGLFALHEGTVTAVVTREEYYSDRSTRFVQDTFEGSLPAFIAAFAKGKGLTEQEISEIREMIDAYGKK